MRLFRVRGDAGGFRHERRAVYLLRSGRFSYAGVTGTSNATGVSSPYKRLASHLAKRGNTQSAFWDNADREGFLPESGGFEFVATFIPERLCVSEVEDALIAGLRRRTGKRWVLNRSGSREVDSKSPEARFAEQFLAQAGVPRGRDPGKLKKSLQRRAGR